MKKIATNRRQVGWAALLVAAASIAVAACGSSSSSSSTSTTTSMATTSTMPAAVTVGTENVPNLGSVLIDPSGMTLYHYTNDTPNTSNCTGGCVTAWPPFTVPSASTPLAGAPGITASSLTVITRADGTFQVAYMGLPLYRYSGDTKAGQVNGQGLGNVWFVMPSAGPSTPPSTTTTAPASHASNTGGGGAPMPTSPPQTAPATTSAPATTAAPTTQAPTTTKGGGYGY